MTTPNDHSLPSLLTEIRWACGDNGKRMLPELVEHIRQQTARLEQLENEVKRQRARQAPLNATVNKLRRENEQLRQALITLSTKYKCGCGHRACIRCAEERAAEQALATGGDK